MIIVQVVHQPTCFSPKYLVSSANFTVCIFSRQFRNTMLGYLDNLPVFSAVRYVFALHMWYLGAEQAQ